MHDVAITGLGVISPVGLTVEDFTSNLDQGQVATTLASWADVDAGRYAWVAPVTGFDPNERLSERIVAGTHDFSQHALVAAMQAVEDRDADFDPLRTGVVFGTTMAGARALLDAQHDLETGGPEAVSRKLQIQAWPNMAGGQIALHYKVHGPLLTVSTACASSLDAIGTAARMIATGLADVIIAGGTDSGMAPALYYSQQSYGMSGHVTDANLASMPFDVRRSGIVEGEGAGVVVLERADLAAKRGARIYGIVAGYGSLSDGYHPSSPEPSGIWEAAAMRAAQADARLASPDDVQSVIAHGTGTPQGDLAEIKAINDVFGDRGSSLAVTSIKGHVGHTGAAAGVMSLIAGLHGMATDTFVHVANTAEVEPSAQFDVVIDKPASRRTDVLQINAFGFGGQDASIVVTRG
jgi:3-oxoacyl-[acyl-carrier-protein] synthase II